MRDAFLATLSHELRTPLGAILGWAYILPAAGVKEAERHHGLEVIERNAPMQVQLIEDVLDMSRITAGKTRLNVQSVHPVHPESFIDAALERVNSQIEISVADTGIGIKPEFLPHVFFRSVPAGRRRPTRTTGGLGLGLSIVKHLVELHGGTVRVTSPGENGGATFTVRLPARIVRLHPDAGERAASDFSKIALSGIKVLVVDDQPNARDLMVRVLTECDAQVLAASSARERLVVVERERPDVLVSDIGMPDGDGYDLFRRVRALGPRGAGKRPPSPSPPLRDRKTRHKPCEPAFWFTSQSRSSPPSLSRRLPISSGDPVTPLTNDGPVEGAIAVRDSSFSNHARGAPATAAARRVGSAGFTRCSSNPASRERR